MTCFWNFAGPKALSAKQTTSVGRGRSDDAIVRRYPFRYPFLHPFLSPFLRLSTFFSPLRFVLLHILRHRGADLFYVRGNQFFAIMNELSLCVGDIFGSARNREWANHPGCD